MPLLQQSPNSSQSNKLNIAVVWRSLVNLGQSLRVGLPYIMVGRVLSTLSLLLLFMLFLFPASVPAQGKLPRPDHIVVVIEENSSFNQVIGRPYTPYINSLAAQGASFTAFFALHHPSQPNYLELFSGSQQNVTDDDCPRHLFSAPSLGGELIARGFSFRGYAEDVPGVGARVCTFTRNGAAYARKHCPWTYFRDVDPKFNLPFTQFPSDFSTLPTIAFVIPNLNHDMHDGKPRVADNWLKRNLDAYVQWAKTHNSLLILTWDEDDQDEPDNTSPPLNRIPTIFIGPMVKPGMTVREQYTHLDLLRTLEEMYEFPLIGGSKSARTISEVWLTTP